VSVGRLVAICSSEIRGVRKRAAEAGTLRQEWGLEGDAHAGAWHRQVSLLAEEDIAWARTRWDLDVAAGDFAENLTTRGIDLLALPIGARLRVGREALLEITQKGKECHTGCAIRTTTGHCVFPTRGVFARVLATGPVRAGDPVLVERGSE
jgi:MOSC domain-containing protein YiiM